MQVESLSVNGAYEFRGADYLELGEHGVVIGFVRTAGEPKVLLAVYYEHNDSCEVVTVRASELVEARDGCICASCQARYWLADRARQVLRDRGRVFCETLSETDYIEDYVFGQA